MIGEMRFDPRSSSIFRVGSDDVGGGVSAPKGLRPQFLEALTFEKI